MFATMIMIKKRNFMFSLSVIPLFTDVGRLGTSLAGMSAIKKIPQ